MFAKLKPIRETQEKGFTLIESLVVILIIAILAAIAIPMFLSHRKGVVDASVQLDVKNTAAAIETWKTKNPAAPITGTGSYYDQSGLNSLSTDSTDKVYTNLKLSNGTMIRVVGMANIGEYKICGYNPDGHEGTAHNNAISYDNTGALKTKVTSGC